VADLVEVVERRAADPLGRRVGRDELGVLLLEPLELGVERVVGVVLDRRVVEDVVAVGVLVELLAELARALGGGRRRAQLCSTSRAAGPTSRSRP
jgi:hypothetical protein